jgi:hypothetical protein
LPSPHKEVLNNVVILVSCVLCNNWSKDGLPLLLLRVGEKMACHFSPARMGLGWLAITPEDGNAMGLGWLAITPEDGNAMGVRMACHHPRNGRNRMACHNSSLSSDPRAEIE